MKSNILAEIGLLLIMAELEAQKRQAAELAANGLPVPAAAETPTPPPRKRGRKPGGKETKK